MKVVKHLSYNNPPYAENFVKFINFININEFALESALKIIE
jgi:hypothetical protein